MRILFFGNTDFGLPTLHSLFNSNHNIIAVITNQDKKSGRGKTYTSTSIKQYSLDNNINLIEAEDINNLDFQDKIKTTKPDLIIVIAFRLLPAKIFNIPSYGTMNLHASLLPKYRGAAPIQRAIINGDSETGISTFFIDENIDTGNLILQRKVVINELDNFISLHDKLSKIGSDLVMDSIDYIFHKKPLIKQEGDPSYAKKIKKNELQIDWSKDVNDIFNRIRAFSPYPGAFSYIENKRVKLFRSKIANSIKKHLSPGHIYINNNRLFVGTSAEPIEILELQQEGKKRMNVVDFINGFLSGKEESIKFKFKE